VLDAKRVEVREERSSRKEPLSDKEVRELLSRVGRVIVSKGKKSTVLPAGKAKPADLRGPTGNYRAPMIRKGKTLLVGFNAEALEDFL
jgi:arsenate reductase-like glutaredoxin family protein